MKTRILKITAAVAACGAAAVFGPSAALAATGTANLSAGSLAFVSTPPDVTFTATLNGQDQTTTATQALDVGDATGSGLGWNITATSTTFSTGGGSPHTLPTSATTVQGAPSDSCDGGNACSTATNSVSYPYSLPAGGTAPTATKLFNAGAGTGMGNQTVTPTWRLAIPASTYAGSYTSTWTLSLVSAP